MVRELRHPTHFELAVYPDRLRLVHNLIRFFARFAEEPYKTVLGVLSLQQHTDVTIMCDQEAARPDRLLVDSVLALRRRPERGQD